MDLARLLPWRGSRRRADPTTAVRRLDAAAGGRRGGGMGTFGQINPEIGAGAALTRSRARYLANNHTFLSNGVGNWVSALVGSGIRPTPRNDDAEMRQAASRAFETWAEEADAAERTDFWGLQADIARHLVVDGEALILFHGDADGLRLQVVAPEQLDEAKTTELGGGRMIVSGVEFDAQGRRVAYWILPHRPHSTYTDFAPSVRFDAADVLHIMRPLGAGQVRGLSWLAPAVLSASELDQLMDALLVGAKTSAMFAGFLTDMNQTGAIPFDGDQTGGILDTGLEPGTLKVLPAGMDVKFSAPDAAKDSPALPADEPSGPRRRPGAPGTPSVRGPHERELFESPGRASALPGAGGTDAIRDAGPPVPFGPSGVDGWQRKSCLGGSPYPRTSPPSGSCPGRCKWTPQKDMVAVKEALALGLTSRTKAVNELGWNADDLDAEIAADRAREADLGLSFTPTETPESDDEA